MIYVAAYKLGRFVRRRRFTSYAQTSADIMVDGARSIGMQVCEITRARDGAKIWPRKDKHENYRV